MKRLLLSIWENTRLAFETLEANRFRSFLTVLGIFIVFGIKQIFAEPAEAMDSFTPFFPLGAGGVLVAMGLTFIAFEGYDLIATVAEEIKEPEKNIPRATFIALAIALASRFPGG